MSVFVQRLSRLRGAYPALLRLCCDNGNHPRRVFGALTKHKRSISSVALIDSTKVQEFAAPTATATGKIGPKKMQENTYAHNFFLNSSKYANTVMRPSTTYAYVTNEEALKILEQDWISMTSAEIVSAVKKLSYNICYSDEKLNPLKYTKAFNTLNIKVLTDDHLMTMMQHLVPFKNHMNENDCTANLRVGIDRECIIRFLQLPIEKTLYLCDVLYQMTPKNCKNGFSQYIWHSIRRLGDKPQKLNPQQLVQILFFLNIYRKLPINMYELEYRLQQCVDDLSINELAIALLGFFKTSTKIRNKDLVKYIIQRTTAEIDVVDTVSIAGIIKLVRYSMRLTEMREFQDLLKVLPSYEPRYTLMTMAHIGQACGRIAVYNKELIDRIIMRLNKEVKTARLKDIERCLYTFFIFNIDSSNSVYQTVIEELRATWDTTRAPEIAQFPYVAARILGYLASQNVYPTDLIKNVMAPEYVTKTCYGNYSSLSREYCVLDYSLRIEVPEYDGQFLKPHVSCSIAQKYYELFLKTGSADSTRANMLFSDVLETCQELFNATSDISLARPLPHFTQPDIIFCLDERNQLVPSEKFLSQFKSNDIKPVDKENSNNVRWIALVLGHYGLLTRNCFTPTGGLAAKMRQLSVIGYTPIMISQASWDTPTKSPQEKRDYIKKLVFQDNVP